MLLEVKFQIGQGNILKKAMSLVELVLVIVIIGILSATLAPNFQRENLRQAANQIVAHIRYTQHLAMIDNKFSNTNKDWFKERWQIRFISLNSDTIKTYSIFSDKKGTRGGPYNNRGDKVTEIAKNPADPNRYLTGGWKNSGSFGVNGRQTTKKMNLTKTFGITNVAFSRSCSYRGSKRLSFDNLGRPFIANSDSAYKKGRYMTAQCQITLVGSDNKTIIIAVEPETGYTHIL